MGLIARALPCNLTDEEWSRCAMEHAVVQNEIAKLDEERMGVLEQFRERRSGLAEKARDLRNMVVAKAEFRVVECEERPNADRLVVDVYRTDTNEFVETRPMTEDEQFAALNPTLPGVQASEKPIVSSTDEACDVADDACADPVKRYTCPRGCGYSVKRCKAHGGVSLGGALGGHMRVCEGPRAPRPNLRLACKLCDDEVQVPLLHAHLLDAHGKSCSPKKVTEFFEDVL